MKDVLMAAEEFEPSLPLFLGEKKKPEGLIALCHHRLIFVAASLSAVQLASLRAERLDVVCRPLFHRTCRATSAHLR
jgi:hypothetical protein